VDCGDDPVEAGDEVVLIGRQGREEITAAELAAWAGTINYEVVCGISSRVPREYRGA
jgi:alanine racemase